MLAKLVVVMKADKLDGMMDSKKVVKMVQMTVVELVK
jgi:hypothetical protein